MAYTPRPDGEVIAELEQIKEGYKRQKQAAITDGSSPLRVGRAIEHCEAGIARLQKEIADLINRRDNWQDIVEMCDNRLDELNQQIATIKGRSELDKLKQQLAEMGLIPNG